MIISIPNYKDETEATCASILSVLMQNYFADPEPFVDGTLLEKTEAVIANCFFWVWQNRCLPSGAHFDRTRVLQYQNAWRTWN